MADPNRGGDARRANEWWTGLSPEELARERQLLLNQARAGSRPAHEALLTSLLPKMHALFLNGMMTICGNLLSSMLRRFGEGGPQDVSRKQPLDEKAADDSRHAYGRRLPSPEDFGALEAGAQLEAALQALPPDQQQIVRWHIQKRYRNVEAAAGRGWMMCSHVRLRDFIQVRL